MKKKIWIPILLIIILIVIIVGFKVIKKNNQIKDKWIVTEITEGDLNVVITSVGTMEALGTVEVGTQISGTIIEIFVDFNSIVEKGDTLAILDTRSLQASLYEAMANYERSRIQMDQTERDYQRNKLLFQENLISKSQYESTSDAYQLAKSNFQISQAQLLRSQINIDNSYIKAPISGVIISKNTNKGQTVAASLNTPTLFTIAEDLTKMEIQAFVDEADIGEVEVGQEVVFDVDAYPQEEFSGIVDQVRLQPVVTSNVVKYIVIINVENADLLLMPGMTANLTININSRDSVLMVPNNALTFMPPENYLKEYFESLPDSLKQRRGQMRMQNQSANSGNPQSPAQDRGKIWIQDGEEIRIIPVRVGLSDGINTEISSPELEFGMLVIIGSNIETEENSSQRSPFLPSRR